jgi:hypothetical protein
VNEQPAFDRQRSAAIRAMLIETVDAADVRNPRRRTRTILAMVVAVLTAVLASGSIALAVGGQDWFGPFPTSVTPTSAATPTPSANVTSTPSPAQSPLPIQAAFPQSVIPVGCDGLLPDGTLDGTMQNARLGTDSVQPFTPQYASVLQAGVLQCQWSGDFEAGGGLLTAYVSTDSGAGTVAIEDMIAAGAQSLSVGDASALSCSDGASCEASLVVGDYWVSYTLRQVDNAVATMEQSGASFVSVLQQQPAPLPAWTPPASPWASAVDCASLTPSTPMAEILGSPELVGPTIPPAGTTPLLVQEADSGLACRWSVPDGVIAPEGQIRSLDVQLAPGTGWVEGDDIFAEAVSTPSDVEGADAAYFRCVQSEGELCWLDVFVDNSWMQLGYADYTSTDNLPLLTEAAEAIIATRG